MREFFYLRVSGGCSFGGSYKAHAERHAGVGSLSPLMYRVSKTLVALTNRCKVMASGCIHASYMRHTGGLVGIYFVRPDMLEKKHRHTHITQSAVKGLSQKSEADYNRVIWR
jgi:hypothetical protein